MAHPANVSQNSPKFKKPSLEQLRTFYKMEIHPYISGLDRKRKSAEAFTLTVSLLIAGFVYFREKNIPRFSNGHDPLIFAGLVGLAIVVVGFAFIALFIRSKSFRSEFKHRVVSRLIERFYPELAYVPMGFVTADQFIESSLFTSDFNRYTGEDFFSGKHGSADFHFSELYVKRLEKVRTKSGQRTRVVDVFSGLFFSADFHRNFFFRTIIKPDTAEGLLGVLGRGVQRVAYGERLVDLEDPEFEKMFVVTADNQVEARYILTPAFMERIKNLRIKMDCQIYVSFVNSRVYVAIPLRENLFEPRIFGSICSMKDLTQFIQSVQTVVGLIDDLEINKDAFVSHGVKPPQQ